MAFAFMDPRRNHLEKSKKSEEAQRVLDALDEYLEGNIAEPVQWLVHFWGDQAAAFTYKELRSIVTETTDPEKIFNIWYQDYSRLIRDRMTSLWRESFLAAAHSDPRLTSVGFDFDFSDRKVKNWILNRTGELITSVTNTQIEAVKYIIAESKTAHMGAEETARYIRPVVGLTQPQAAANLKYYNSVKEKLREDHPRMKDASIERKAREAAAKYAGKQQRERAHTIAETEMAMAYNRGMDDSIRQAVNKGILPVMRKVWSTSGNGLVCGACLDLEGTEIDMDKEFSITIGKKVKRELKAEVPPLHPRCHCAVVYEETGQWVEPESEYREIKEPVADNIDSEEYIHSQELLGQDAPKTLDEYKDIKYSNDEQWKFMQLDLKRRTYLLDHPELILPNADRVEIDDRKFSEYLFNKNNPHGWAKGMAFESRLGYTIDNWHLLKEELKSRASLYPTSYKGVTSYGHKYQQRIVIYGMKGTPANVEVGWIVNNDGHTVMTSAYINEVEKNEY